MGEDAAYTQAYLQATMDEYVNLKRDLLEKTSASAESSMEATLEDLALELKKSKEDVINYQSSNKVVFLQPTGGNSAADFLSSKTRQLAEKRSELKTLEQLTFDQNLERQQGIFAQGPGTQLVEPNNIPKQPLPGPPGTVSQQSSNAPPQPGPAQTQANNDATQKNIPPNLGELEVAYLQARQQLVILNTKRDMLLKRLWPTAPAVREVTYEIATQENLLKGFKEQSEAQLKDRKYILGSEIKT